MQLTPRRLTTHQKAVLIHVLVTFPDQQVGIRYSGSASDALGYAEDFLTIFKAIGWNVEGGVQSETLAREYAGLALVVRDLGSLPPSAEAFRDALRIYGIEAGTFCDPSCPMSPGGFILTVGPQI